ncbi:uncharacterized protein L201_005540 [Kwoniella dendrophila CBS 6074]|uniref:Uncharacterized protein n=1 Tax=Kwoniella dendrophila CBS 6074 TaxID=1295534 RepID=A0AAX4K0C3_9TREE
MSQPTSPVLRNSSFSHLDCFASSSKIPSDRTSTTIKDYPIFTLHLTSSPSNSPSGSSAYPYSYSPTLISTPDRGRSSSPCSSISITNSERELYPSDEIHIELGSPQVLSSPKLGVKRDSKSSLSARKSIQFGKDKHSSTSPSSPSSSLSSSSPKKSSSVSTAVNWARPLRVTKEKDSKQDQLQESIASMRIFGASLQKSRRLNNKTPTEDLSATATASPCSSSDDEDSISSSPITPSTDINDNIKDLQIESRGWSVFGSSAKGLGVSGVAEWDTPVCTPIRELSLEETLPQFDFSHIIPITIPSSTSSSSLASSSITPPPIPKKGSSSSSTSAATLPRSVSKPVLKQSSTTMNLSSIADSPLSCCNPRILATSQSLNSFSSPSNLAELRNLRQAAIVLENEARKPIPINSGSTTTTAVTKENPRERKIKRKAVPSIAESDIIDYYSTSSSSCANSTSSSSSPSSSLATPTSSIQISSSPESILASSSSSLSSSSSIDQKQRRRNSAIDQILIPRQLPGMGMGNSIFNKHRQLYQNHLATRSVIEISPRLNKTLPTFDENEVIIIPRINSSPPLTSSPSKAQFCKNKFDSNLILKEGINLSSTSTSSSMYENEDSSLQPITTPNSKSNSISNSSSLSASQTEYFLNSVENAFKKLEFERAEISQQKSSNLIIGSKEKESKHKRGFSRFLGKKE